MCFYFVLFSYGIYLRYDSLTSFLGSRLRNRFSACLQQIGVNDLPRFWDVPF